MCEINIGFKDERVRLLLLHAPCQIAVYHKAERLVAVGALALDFDHQWFVT